MSNELFTDEKSRKQIAIFKKYRNFSVDELNCVGLARWQSQKNSGAWDHENYLANFSEETENA